MLRRTIITAVLSLFLLASCQHQSNDALLSQMQMLDRDLQFTKEQFKRELLRPVDTEAAVDQAAELEPAIPELASMLMAPEAPKLPDNKRVSISVSDNVPLKDVLIELSRQADINLELDPAISGGVVLRVKDKPVDQVMESIARLANLRYSMVDGTLKIERDLPYLHHYSVDFLNLDRSNEGGVNISTQVLNSSGGDSGGGLTAGSTNVLTAKYDGGLWASIEASIKQILEDGAAKAVGNQVSLNRQAGVITVLADSKQHKSISEYLDKTRRSATSQVLIEAKIVEVTLNEDYQAGINWNAVDDNIQFGVNGSFLSTLSSDNTDLIKITALQNKGGSGIEGVVSLVEKFGTTRTLSSPRLLATNNQQAVLTFAENEVYFTTKLEDEDKETASGTTESTLKVESTIHTVPIGVILTLQPSINLDNHEITMNVRPTLSRIKKRVEDPATNIIAASLNLNNIKSEIPVIEVREMDSILKIANGQVMVIGGLMEERVTTSESGIPGLKDIPGLGKLFKGESSLNNTVETVIFIRATIVPGHGVDPKDRHFYKTFARDPRPVVF